MVNMCYALPLVGTCNAISLKRIFEVSRVTDQNQLKGNKQTSVIFTVLLNHILCNAFAY